MPAAIILTLCLEQSARQSIPQECETFIPGNTLAPDGMTLDETAANCARYTGRTRQPLLLWTDAVPDLCTEVRRLGQRTRILVRVSVGRCLLSVSFSLIALSSPAMSYHRTSTGERLVFISLFLILKPDRS
jgi:hypothetical protein